jgi:hypothetical protein
MTKNLLMRIKDLGIQLKIQTRVLQMSKHEKERLSLVVQDLEEMQAQ